MAATTFHSVIRLFWKETAFPRWRAMDSRWKRNSVSLVSSVTTVWCACQSTASLLLLLLLLLLSAPDRHRSWTSSWSHLETSHRLLKKPVAELYRFVLTITSHLLIYGDVLSVELILGWRNGASRLRDDDDDDDDDFFYITPTGRHSEWPQITSEPWRCGEIWSSRNSWESRTNYNEAVERTEIACNIILFTSRFANKIWVLPYNFIRNLLTSIFGCLVTRQRLSIVQATVSSLLMRPVVKVRGG